MFLWLVLWNHCQQFCHLSPIVFTFFFSFKLWFSWYDGWSSILLFWVLHYETLGPIESSFLAGSYLHLGVVCRSWWRSVFSLSLNLLIPSQQKRSAASVPHWIWVGWKLAFPLKYLTSFGWKWSSVTYHLLPLNRGGSLASCWALLTPRRGKVNWSFAFTKHISMLKGRNWNSSPHCAPFIRGWRKQCSE